MSEGDFDEFVRVRLAALGRVAFLLTGDRHHAEDLVQTALARAAVRWERLDDPEAYVRRVIYTQAVSWWRVQRRRRPEMLVDAPPERSAPGADHDTRIVLGRALARLTRKQRAVLILRYYEDHTESETARLLSVGLGTVKSQTRHALRRLRGLKGADCPSSCTRHRGKRPPTGTIRSGRRRSCSAATSRRATARTTSGRGGGPATRCIRRWSSD